MYSPYNFNMYNNPYNNIFQPQQPQTSQANILPQQQIIQVNGRASVDTIQLAPNSSVLVMDTSAPMVWLCVSDGVGKVTATPYDITEHKEKPLVDTASLEQRVTAVENFISKLMEGANNESNVAKPKSKQTSTKSDTN